MKHSYESYILAFGPHPDDVEIGCGGVIYRSGQEGKKNIIIDLSPSQLSTAGDPTTRQEEASAAGQILGVYARHNCDCMDGDIRDDMAHRIMIATYIRKYKPEIVLIPRSVDRHPDHEQTAHLVKNAVLYAGLAKIDCEGLPVHKPRLLLHYVIWQDIPVDFVIPLTTQEYEVKLKAFGAYTSQKPTNDRGLNYIHARHTMWGAMIGHQYGEGFILYSHKVGVRSLDDIVSGFF